MVMQGKPPTKAMSATLWAIKTTHTIVWAAFAGCIVAIPVASWRGEHRTAARLSAIVAGEVAVLVFNGWRCPLTSLASHYTDDRRQNFDIYLPEWLARNNKLVFGALYLAGVAFALARWARASS
jgi:polyferredoxin